jgi:hypothetical protein
VERHGATALTLRWKITKIMSDEKRSNTLGRRHHCGGEEAEQEERLADNASEREVSLERKMRCSSMKLKTDI